jgi:hypothetical protein
MGEEEREELAAQQAERVETGDEEDDDEGGNPFDHPAFLPAVLWPMALWFGYDGWINQDPGMLEHVTFNRGGFAVLVVLGIYFTVKAVREMREES